MLKNLSWRLRTWKSWEDSESEEENVVKVVRRYPEGPTLGRKQRGNLPSSMQMWASIRVVHKKPVLSGNVQCLGFWNRENF